jgi:hypothetical protein
VQRKKNRASNCIGILGICEKVEIFDTVVREGLNAKVIFQ